MSAAKTHRLVSKPQVSARYLADFMAASEQGRRSIIKGCKFRPIARVIQHRKARNIIGTFLRAGKAVPPDLIEEAQALRDTMADDDFDRDVLDNNADYVERFAEVASNLVLPAADMGQDALQDNTQPEGKLCLTIDAYQGACHPAPTDAVRRFHNMQAACASIAERWDNVPPPPGAVF